jgi:diguanylate cyclase (GGDEF)-like protein
MTNPDTSAEILNTEQFAVEKGSDQSEDAKRTTFWLDYVKTHSPDATAQMIVQKEKEADIDSLTGIYNRRGWEKQVEVFTSLAERNNEPVSFCMIDVDDFKAINDTWGHGFGDIALKFVAKVAKDSLRESDTLARIGGDEFGILLPKTDSNGANVIRDRVVAELKKSFDEMDDNDALKAAELSVSIGVSTKSPTENVNDTMFKADQDMYKVKGSKKNV